MPPRRPKPCFSFSRLGPVPDKSPPGYGWFPGLGLGGRTRSAGRAGWRRSENLEYPSIGIVIEDPDRPKARCPMEGTPSLASAAAGAATGKVISAARAEREWAPRWAGGQQARSRGSRGTITTSALRPRTGHGPLTIDHRLRREVTLYLRVCSPPCPPRCSMLAGRRDSSFPLLECYLDLHGRGNEPGVANGDRGARFGGHERGEGT